MWILKSLDGHAFVGFMYEGLGRMSPRFVAMDRPMFSPLVYTDREALDRSLVDMEKAGVSVRVHPIVIKPEGE